MLTYLIFILTQNSCTYKNKTGSTSTSLWTHYAKGVRSYCGHDLPDNLQKNQKLAENILTPTTKDDEHDELISAEEILAKGT